MRLLLKQRRKAERVRTPEILFIQYRSPVHLTSGEAEGKDVSTAGIRFACLSRFPIGIQLDLTLRFCQEFNPDETLEARGIVIRCYRKHYQRRYRIACSFDHLDALSHDLLQRFILWLKARRSSPT